MSRQDDHFDRTLDDTLAEIRRERLEPQSEKEALERVWQRLEAKGAGATAADASRIGSCRDFQALIPDYLAKRLPQGRALLVKDHFGECVTCRRALNGARSKRVAASDGPARRGANQWASKMGWRVAAAAVIFLGLIGISFKTDALSFETGGMIRIESIQGELFRVTEGETVPLAEGDVIDLERGDAIRTARGSSAVLAMADDSQIEMRERSALAVKQRRHLLPGRRPDGVIGLERGSIIVEASDQGSGHLYVDTEDCEVAVKGTVFAVNHGTKGSRVSVVEGEVHVNYRGNEDILLPGQQTTTHPSLNKVPVAMEVAWSRKSAQYAELLKEMQALSREIDEAFKPELRYSTDLLDLVPASTVFYVAIPNLSDELGEAYDILENRIAANEVLRDWWENSVTGHDEIETILDKIRAYGDQLGNEVILAQGPDASGEMHDPLFLARLEGPQAFERLLEEEIAELEASDHGGLWMHVLEGPLPAAPPQPAHARDTELYFWIQNDLVVFSSSFERLREQDAVLQGSDGASLAGSAFHDRISGLYAEGVEWIVGIDLEGLIRGDANEMETLDRFGILDAQHLVAERKQQNGRTQNRAVLSFDQPRRRLAGWLAEPAAMGALEYVSPDAGLAAAFVMQEAGLLVDELFDFLGQMDENFEVELTRFELEKGINIRRDVAAPLGGEFVIALDGPIVPTPSWKLVLEVYDPVRLQQTLEWLVEQINQLANEAGKQGFRLQMESVGGREFFRLESLDTALAMHYVFDDGYLVAGPSRALLDRALRNRRAGFGLQDSPDFMRLLPQDNQVNFSGAIYQNLGPVVGGLSHLIAGAANNMDLSREDREMLVSMGAEAKPSLALFYGEEDAIVFVSTSEGGLLTSGLSSLSGFSGLLGVQQSLARAMEADGQAD